MFVSCSNVNPISLFLFLDIDIFIRCYFPLVDFYMDFDGSLSDANVQRLLEDLGPLTTKLLILDEKQVQWFPRHISELDLIAHRTLDAGTDLESDHPGFHDKTYRDRRAALAESAIKHRWTESIPRIEYTPEETAVWTAVWDRMQDLWKKYACKEYLVSFDIELVNSYSFLFPNLVASPFVLWSLPYVKLLIALDGFVASKLWLQP